MELIFYLLPVAFLYICKKQKRCANSSCLYYVIFRLFFYLWKKSEIFIFMIFYIFCIVQSRIRSVEPAHSKKALSSLCSFLRFCEVKKKEASYRKLYIFQQVFFRNLASNINISLMKRTKMLQERIPVYAIVKDTT